MDEASFKFILIMLGLSFLLEIGLTWILYKVLDEVRNDRSTTRHP